ncbi:MAG: glycosyltransferase family 2 protein, partial [Candidatus Omnitrophica bacterium]|nr:glycosyltransferase family 2 protein [Candidatus Omnitrophota bacterium]
MNILISAIVCSHNRSAFLNKAIQSLTSQSLQKNKYEIVIIDNASTDNTKKSVIQSQNDFPDHNIRYVYEENLGLSIARNRGICESKANYLAYLDDDAIADKFWLENILNVFETTTEKTGIVGGKVIPHWESPRPIWLHDLL